MKDIKKLAILSLLLLFLISSCYKDNEEYLYGGECKTSEILYSEDIAPLLTNHCVACHSMSNASSIGGNIILDNYDDLKLKAEDGSLLGALSHDSNYSPMPRNSPQLNECSISMIATWISEGMQNN